MPSVKGDIYLKAWTTSDRLPDGTSAYGVAAFDVAKNL